MTDANYLTGMKFGMGAFDDMNHFGGEKRQIHSLIDILIEFILIYF